MRKGLVFILGAAVLLSSCSSNAAGGAYAGGQFGYIIGSAIGGISGGWRGHDKGALIGTIGGLVAGAVIGSAIDQAQEKEVQQRTTGINRRTPARHHDNSGYDPQGRGDDRITFAADESPLEIRNAMIVESQHDGVLTRGEECMVMFEIMNTSDKPVYDVRPIVEDVTGNKHVKVSPNLKVESIAPHQGVRYTATILADRKLKDGEIQVMVGVAQGKQEVASQTRCFTVPTAKRAR
ncbi:MAG: hypothetical protein IJ588_09835 [Prevotella sp.]|nr:hypothetical protein [Prevotella sp.]